MLVQISAVILLQAAWYVRAKLKCTKRAACQCLWTGVCTFAQRALVASSCRFSASCCSSPTLCKAASRSPCSILPLSCTAAIKESTS